MKKILFRAKFFLIKSIENNSKLPSNAVVLTFDDGYVDHYLNAFPVLDRLGLQGSFYIPVKPVVEHYVLDDNKIQFIISALCKIYGIELINN